jgi:hypothetical protein
MFMSEKFDLDDCNSAAPVPCFNVIACDKKVCKSYDVSLPVTITVFALAERPEVVCDGDVQINPGRKICESQMKTFEYTISQRLNIEIPIEFGANVCCENSCVEDKGKCCPQPEL